MGNVFRVSRAPYTGRFRRRTYSGAEYYYRPDDRNSSFTRWIWNGLFGFGLFSVHVLSRAIYRRVNPETRRIFIFSTKSRPNRSVYVPAVLPGETARRESVEIRDDGCTALSPAQRADRRNCSTGDAGARRYSITRNGRQFRITRSISASDRTITAGGQRTTRVFRKRYYVRPRVFRRFVRIIISVDVARTLPSTIGLLPSIICKATPYRSGTTGPRVRVCLPRQKSNLPPNLLIIYAILVTVLEFKVSRYWSEIAKPNKKKKNTTP